MPHLPAYTLNLPPYILYPIVLIPIRWGAIVTLFAIISPRRGPVSLLKGMISILFTIISHLLAPASPLKKVTKKILGGGISPLRTDTEPLGIELTPVRLEIDPFRC